MQIPGQANTGATGVRPAFALAVDTGSIIVNCGSVLEARALPCGCVVGDMHGGLTFSDAVAAVLESRSVGGWQEMPTQSGDVWTIIVINR